MRTISFSTNTSKHLFVSVDGLESVPNESHPIWRRFSEAEKSRLLAIPIPSVDDHINVLVE